MKKNIILGIVAFGGLVLIGNALLNDTSELEEINETIPAATLPTEVTTQFPMYPEAELTTVHESTDETSIGYSFSLSAEATKNEVLAWYREALNQNGWSITSDKNVAGYQIIQAENNNLYTTFQTANGSQPGFVVISQQAKIRQ